MWSRDDRRRSRRSRGAACNRSPRRVVARCRARGALARPAPAAVANRRAPLSAHSGSAPRDCRLLWVSPRACPPRGRTAACPRSCPTAETTGTGQAETARTTTSSLNGRRSSKLPPPRARTSTSTSGCAASAPSAAAILAGAPFPWTRVSQTTTFAAGKRAPIVATRSPRAAASAPVRIPIRAAAVAADTRAGEKSPSAASSFQPLQREEVRAEPDPLDRRRAEPELALLLVQLRATRDVHGLAFLEREREPVEGAATDRHPERGSGLRVGSGSGRRSPMPRFGAAP